MAVAVSVATCFATFALVVVPLTNRSLGWPTPGWFTTLFGIVLAMGVASIGASTRIRRFYVLAFLIGVASVALPALATVQGDSHLPLTVLLTESGVLFTLAGGLCLASGTAAFVAFLRRHPVLPESSQ